MKEFALRVLSLDLLAHLLTGRSSGSIYSLIGKKKERQTSRIENNTTAKLN